VFGSHEIHVIILLSTTLDSMHNYSEVDGGKWLEYINDNILVVIKSSNKIFDHK
jgi:hypothetical protein